MNKVQLLLWSALCFLVAVSEAGKGGKSSLEEVVSLKDFKKLLRTKNNVLALFHELPRGSGDIRTLMKDLSDRVRGSGTVVSVDCGDKEARKMCKQLKISPDTVPDKFVLKHYKDGSFHKDYDWAVKLSSLTQFMANPTADQPWQENPHAADIVHLDDPAQFSKFFKKEKGPVMVMFYAPWCGFCKRMKPDYQQAATELKGTAVLAAMDVNQPHNSVISRKFNITGFPTLLFFDKGEMQYAYPGENQKKDIVSFMKNPVPGADKDSGSSGQASKEPHWSDEASEVVHLTSRSFDDFVGNYASVLVMFYAPWCGHCKRIKPNYVAAADQIMKLGLDAKLAAVDATVEVDLAKRFDVKGYPTLKFFQNGEFKFEAGHVREEKAIVDFMKDPKEPPPPPPPEQPWSETVSDVVHLTDSDFKAFLRKKKHVLVMFYAPWCGHCKSAKPEFMAAAAEFKDNAKVEFAAVDCTEQRDLCSTFSVSGFPTFKYFKYYNQEQRPYDGGRSKKDFVSFMKNPDSPSAGQPEKQPSPEEAWAEHDGAEFVTHLTDRNFDAFLKTKDHILAVFYAPWCGHCVSLKPDFAAAAKLLSGDKLSSALVAVDATMESSLSSRFNIKGYPTIKYFFRGQFHSDYPGGRRKKDFVDFIQTKGRTEPTSSKDEL